VDSSRTGISSSTLNGETKIDELEGVGLRPEYDPLRDSVRILWTRRPFLLRVTAIGILLSIVVALLLPVEYKSTVRLMPPDSESGGKLGLLMSLAAAGGSGGGGGGSLGGMAMDMLGMKTSGDVLMEMMRSRSLQDRLIIAFDLQKVYGAKLMEDARLALKNHTKIVQEKKSGVISITVDDRDKQRAMRLASAYVDELDRSVVMLNTSAAHRERVFLENRLKEIKQDLDLAVKELSQFASKNTTIDPQQQGKAMVDAAARLQGELIAAESELKGLEQIYTPQNVRVRSIQARINELKRQLSDMGGGSEGNAGKSGSGYPSIRELPLLSATYADYFRRAKVQEIVYETLTKQYEVAKVEEAKELPSIRVMDPANLPERKSWPPRKLVVLIGTFLFLIAGSIWVIVSDRWQQLDPQDSRKQLVADAVAGLGVARRDLAGDRGRLNLMAARFRRRKSPPANGSDSGQGDV
jgi:uncharacterized protein involved in exopolysaccharide biosynthesis